MIWTLVAVAVGIVVALFAYSLARASADGDRVMAEAHQDYLLRYQGPTAACVVCGIETRYSLHGKPMHPGCRRDVA